MENCYHAAGHAAISDAEDADPHVAVEGELHPAAVRDVDVRGLERRDPVILRRGLLRIARHREGHVLALAARVLRGYGAGTVRILVRLRRALARRNVPPRRAAQAAERLRSALRVDEDLALGPVLVEVVRIRERGRRNVVVPVARLLAVEDDSNRPDVEERLPRVAVLVVARPRHRTREDGAPYGQ